MVYNFANFQISIHNRFKPMERMCVDYLTDSSDEKHVISISDEDIVKELNGSEYGHTRGYVEYICIYRKLAEWLPLHNAFLLHSAVFDVDGTGVAFAAHSGTGKTTHMLLWQKLLGDKMTIVNGDKPIVRFFDDEPDIPYAYGTPWCGKENLGCNMRTPVKHICFIERAEQNSCEKMDKNDAIDLIFNQVYMPKDPIAVMNTLKLINKFISVCDLWKIKCNMDTEAAELAYKEIFLREKTI